MHRYIFLIMTTYHIFTMTQQNRNGPEFSKVKAILFDLHHTITKTRVGMLALTREAGKKVGIDFDAIHDNTLREAIQKTDEWLKEFQTANNVDIHWGGKPHHWLKANRLLIEELRIPEITDDSLIEFERTWKEIMATNWESLVDGAKHTLETLRQRGYILGICTRRHDNPESLLKEWKILHLFSTIQYSGVPGYAKPSPFTLLRAAKDIGVNPRLCAYVGNYANADVAAALRAEMIPILTIWANPEERNLVDENITVIDKIDELLGFFD